MLIHRVNGMIKHGTKAALGKEENHMKKNTNKLIALLAAATLLFGVAGCKDAAGADNGAADAAGTEKETIGNRQQEENGATDLKTVKIAGISQGEYLSGIPGVAQQLGFFEEELAEVGYVPDFEGFQSGPAVNEAFASGDIDVALIGDLPALTAEGAGLQTRVFAAYGKQIQYGILAQPDDTFSSFKDIEGKRMVVPKGTVLQYFVEQVLTDNGVDISKVEFVNDTSIQTFLSKEVDFYPSVLYIVDAYEKEGYGKVVYSSVDAPQYCSTGLGFAKEAYIEENPEVIKAIYDALERTAEYVKEHPQEYYQMLSDASSGTFQPESFEAEYVNDSEFESLKPEITDQSIEWLKKLEKFAEDNQLITSEVDIDAWVYRVEEE